MTYEDLIVLIPSHSLEDFPVEQSDDDAASLLNAFAVPWHPAILAASKVLPRWHRADDPPDSAQRRLIMLPTSCESWVPAGWVARVEQEGSVVVRGRSNRDDMIRDALKPLEGTFQVSPDLAADFIALGFCYLQTELLTRKMRNFSNLDEVHLQREAVAGAEAALAGDEATARSRLRACFEVLTEARERFYPVDCYLIDLCLLIPRLADQHLSEALLNLKPMNVLASVADLEQIAAENPDALNLLREAWDRGTLDMVAGEYRESPTPLLPIASIVSQLARGVGTLDKLFERKPTMWGRRRFGVFPLLPQFLKRFGFEGALHAVLDDGIYPDAEHSKIAWEGSDGSVIDAISRIPLAVESASSYLRFSTRMAESMDNDHVAGLVFARWPEVKAPWFDDLRRMHNYSPVLGRFVTFKDFFQNTENPGRTISPKPHEYLTPFLVQGVAYQEDNPISRFPEHLLRRQKFDSARWFRGLSAILSGQTLSTETDAALETAIEDFMADLAPANETIPTADVARARADALDADIATSLATAAARVAEMILTGGGTQPGYLVLNPLSFKRMISVEFDARHAMPAAPGGSSHLQWDERHKVLTVEVPGAGFVWIPAAPAGTQPPRPPATATMAEPLMLRNEFFEVRLNAQTGGLQQLKGYGRSPNRLSQQLGFRYSRERTFTVGEGELAEEVKSHYAEMRLTGSEILSSGPAVAEIMTTGDIIDQKKQERLAGFRQTFRVYRGKPVLEIDVELDIVKMPDAEPWLNYFTSRFAWNDDTASLTQSSLMGAHELREDRFESPYYVEIAVDDQRTTILPFGMPFHRKSGARMFDTILVAPKETKRKFRFAIACDQNYPLQAALDAMSPAVMVPTTQGPPASGSTGWFFHLNARSVQITEILPLMHEPRTPDDTWDSTARHETAPPLDRGCALRLVETEGRGVRANLRCVLPPVHARQRNFIGDTVADLTIEGDAVVVELTPYEIADIELRF